MKFKYLITEVIDCIVTGTNEEAIVEEFKEYDNYSIIDVVQGVTWNPSFGVWVDIEDQTSIDENEYEEIEEEIEEETEEDIDSNSNDEG